MKPVWSLLAITVPRGGALALLIVVLVAYQYGNKPSRQDMELAAELGAAIGGALTFTSLSICAAASQAKEAVDLQLQAPDFKRLCCGRK